MIQCSETTWCCSDQGGQSCCGTPSSIITLPIASTLGSIGPGSVGFVVATSKGNLLTTVATQTTTSSNSSSSSSSSSAITTSSSASVSTTATAISSTTPSATIPTQTSKSSSDTGAIAGGTIGGGVLIALIGAAVFYFLRHTKRPAGVTYTGQAQELL
jgi:hypothetical protein